MPTAPSRLRAGENFVAMMSNGTSGDINNLPFLVTRPPRERFEQIRIVARKAADLHVSDRIHVSLDVPDRFARAVESFGEYVAEQTLASAIGLGPDDGDGGASRHEASVGGEHSPDSPR